MSCRVRGIGLPSSSQIKTALAVALALNITAMCVDDSCMNELYEKRERIAVTHGISSGVDSKSGRNV